MNNNEILRGAEPETQYEDEPLGRPSRPGQTPRRAEALPQGQDCRACRDGKKGPGPAWSWRYFQQAERCDG